MIFSPYLGILIVLMIGIIAIIGMVGMIVLNLYGTESHSTIHGAVSTCVGALAGLLIGASRANGNGSTGNGSPANGKRANGEQK